MRRSTVAVPGPVEGDISLLVGLGCDLLGWIDSKLIDEWMDGVVLLYTLPT